VTVVLERPATSQGSQGLCRRRKGSRSKFKKWVPTMAWGIQRRKEERTQKENWSRHFSEPAVFVAKVLLLKQNQLTFWCSRQQAHHNIQNITNNRSFGIRKTYLFRRIFFRNFPNERALREVKPNLPRLASTQAGPLSKSNLNLECCSFTKN